MNKLQIRVDRTDAELISRALRFFHSDEPDITLAPRALELATWLDHRILAYFGALRPEPPASEHIARPTEAGIRAAADRRANK